MAIADPKGAWSIVILRAWISPRRVMEQVDASTVVDESQYP